MPSRIGRLNRRALFARLQRLGQASRAELAKALGMSQPTAGKIVEDLLARGVVEEVRTKGSSRRVRLSERADPRRVRVGRPGRLVQPAQSRLRFLAVQLGVTQTHVVALPAAAPAEDQWTAKFPTPADARTWVERLQREAPRVAARDRWGILVSVPGVVDELEGRVLYSPNLHWTEATDLPRLLRSVWDAPVLLVQEERALALGQLAFDKSGEDFLLVDFGEGVGGAVVLGGRLYESPLPISGELGHTPVLGNVRRCGCGATGCVETLVSTGGLLESFAATRSGGVADWAALRAEVGALGMPFWLERAVEGAAGAIAGALNVLGIRRVLVTGDLVELGNVVTDRLALDVARGSMWARFGRIDCVTVPRRRTAGLVSAGVDRLVLPTGEPVEVGLAYRTRTLEAEGRRI